MGFVFRLKISGRAADWAAAVPAFIAPQESADAKILSVLNAGGTVDDQADVSRGSVGTQSEEEKEKYTMQCHGDQRRTIA